VWSIIGGAVFYVEMRQFQTLDWVRLVPFDRYHLCVYLVSNVVALLL